MYDRTTHRQGLPASPASRAQVLKLAAKQNHKHKQHSAINNDQQTIHSKQ